MKGDSEQNGISLWKQILILAEQKGVMGSKMVLNCKIHSQNNTVSNVDDWNLIMQGGCKERCDAN
jgi:hypothetical protein